MDSHNHIPRFDVDDEILHISPEVWHKLFPRLKSIPNNNIIITSTPKGEDNWFQKKFLEYKHNGNA